MWSNVWLWYLNVSFEMGKMIEIVDVYSVS